jgi:rhamnose utilization protein RhaD (predicted bifunctional aldolase and dehydrogenase)/NAD(P)-dependent dehydrogenase (short-subunit alcohol dehydrogenase family)
MLNHWSDDEAKKCESDPLKLRVYTSRLIGKDPALVLHGGGNTSVKLTRKNIFQEDEHLLCVKGSGWDLATIAEAGFSPIRMEVLMKLAHLNVLSDTDMVREQKSAMVDPNAPGPSIEAILHALIPFKFVDHTHADAIVAITNTPGGEEKIKKVFGERVLYIPYVMPGFDLARKVFEVTQDADWSKYEGMILLNHGIFSFADDAKTSYDRMINLVSVAENFIAKEGKLNLGNVDSCQTETLSHENNLKLAQLRKAAGKTRGTAVVTCLNTSSQAKSFSKTENVMSFANRGPLTPDHVIHTKRTPAFLTGEPEACVEQFVSEYKSYYERNKKAGLTMLDPSPRWAVWPGVGTVSFGTNVKTARVVSDISRHTGRALLWAEKLGGWQALPEKNIFEVEYWELEQAKLKKSGGALPLAGKVALVTGAASGIGKACAEGLRAQGAAVAVLDISPSVVQTFKGDDVLPIVCDMTDKKALQAAIEQVVSQFGGLDILVSNAGAFPPGQNIESLSDDTWNKTMDLNLTANQLLFKYCIPYLSLGFSPSIVVIASKNVPAPGPGAAAYSVAKAGLTQLARVAALELGVKGIRVNVIHPNAVFDTSIWTGEVLQNRAKHYGVTVDEYKTNNVMKVEITSKDVANLAVAMAGPAFSKTTGAQVAVDGGNDRVI